MVRRKASSKRSSIRKGPKRKPPSTRKPRAPAPPPAPPSDGAGFPIVGVGASAGGLRALEELLGAMPAASGVAVVVITHQHPDQASLLPEILARKTLMPVVEVSRPTRALPDHVYTVKPGHLLSIARGVLRPQPIDRAHAVPMQVDHFFRSLAQDQRDRAVGIVLSGTGTDGTLGLKEIKGELGLVMVQDEQSAQYAGMPHSAIGTRLADHVLAPAAMPEHLVAFAKALQDRTPAPAEEASPAGLQPILDTVRKHTGHDFSQYKANTIRRRVERRMQLHRLDTFKAYAQYLRSTPREAEALFQELLIGVTSFFRDPDAWQALSGPLTALLTDKPDDYVLRAWVSGCSTGEEAYSLAILIRECMDALGRSTAVQLFATDLDPAAIAHARAGYYPAGIAGDVSAQRLQRFFTREDDAYRVRREIREMLVFAPQSLIADPPFTKLDLVSCRNLLIYLDGNLQRRLLPVFHYALRPRGLLFLGTSEAVGTFSELFRPLDKKWKIFARRDGATGVHLADFPSAIAEAPSSEARLSPKGRDASLAQLADRLLLRTRVPPTVLVQERGDVVHIHGRTGLYLEPAQGAQATANLFNMAREGLQVSLAAAMRQAAAEDKEVVHRGVRVKTNGHTIQVDLRVARVREPERLRGLYCISFEETAAVDAPAEAGGSPVESGRYDALERELQLAKESHQATIEELETSNEELKSTNEELQSTNEELETSKEEMQSLNEELQTVNAELQGKVEQLSDANNDMRNLLNGTEIATVFLDNDLNIRRFTEQARKVIRIIPTDVGRPIGDLVSRLRYDRLVEDAREVLRTLVFREIEVQGTGEAWFLMRILPYRTTENVIDGLVLTFVDITKLRRLQDDRRRLVEVLRTSTTKIFEQDLELRFRWVAQPVFGHEPEALVGKRDADVFEPAVARAMTALKRDVLASRVPARQRFEIGLDGSSRVYDLFVEPTREESGEVSGVACVVTDLTAVDHA